MPSPRRDTSRTKPRNVAMGSDIQQVRAVAQRLGMTKEERDEFRAYIHKCKQLGIRGTKNDRGDFTFQELTDLGRQFLEEARG
jgi:hypothetical protein